MKRVFDSGATRNSETGKLDFEGFMSPLVLCRYAEYMDDHRILEDKTIRDSDDWQKGIPISSYMKSLCRHLISVWLWHRGYKSAEDLETSLCGIIFNASGYLHEILQKPQRRRKKKGQTTGLSQTMYHSPASPVEETDSSSAKDTEDEELLPTLVGTRKERRQQPDDDDEYELIS